MSVARLSLWIIIRSSRERADTPLMVSKNLREDGTSTGFPHVTLDVPAFFAGTEESLILTVR